MSKKRRNEIILIVVVLLLAVGYFAYTRLKPEKKGAEVVVYVFGDEYARFPLNEDREFVIAYLKNSNVLVIEDGYAYIREASCPDGLCIHQGKINKSGQMLVCLPNQVVVQIEGPDKKNNDIDSTAN